MEVNTRTDTMSNIASYYGVNSQKLQGHYKHEVSGFKDWPQLPHAEEYLIYPENITDKLSIDEVSLSRGELYTFITLPSLVLRSTSPFRNWHNMNMNKWNRLGGLRQYFAFARDAFLLGCL
jgi:hypothetical protein